MFSFFKSGKNKPSTIKSTYYIREGLVHNISDLIKLLLPAKEANTLEENTTIEIKFKNLSLTDLTEREIISEMGQPIYIHDNSEALQGHKVLFYKEDVEFYRFLVQFHFMNDKFFFVSNKVTSSGMLSETEKGKIVNQICNKYLNKTADKQHKFLFRLTDKNGSLLNTIDDVYFYVNYLSGGSIKAKLINRFSDSSNIERKEPGFEDTIDKYF